MAKTKTVSSKKKEVSKVAKKSPAKKKAPAKKKGINVVEMEVTHASGDTISIAFTGSKDALGLFVDAMGAGLKLVRLSIKGKLKA